MSLLDHDFDREYDIMLSAWGEGELNEEALLPMQRPDAILSEYKKKHRLCQPKSISLLLEDPTSIGCNYFYTGISSALLEKLTVLKELVLPDTVTDIEVTPKIAEIFKKNDTLIRGSFDSFAEKFAAENGLHFRPADLIIAEYYFEPARESTQLTLLFKRNGGVMIKESISSPGTSVSNTLGGTFMHSLKSEFYKTETAETVADKFSPALRDAILNDGRFADFIRRSAGHKIYAGKN